MADYVLIAPVGAPGEPSHFFHRHGGDEIEMRPSEPEPFDDGVPKVRTIYTCPRCGDALRVERPRRSGEPGFAFG